MHWKEQVARLEQEGSFDIAIFLLQKVIAEHPDNVDAYIFLLYRLMDTLIEGSCYWSNISKDPLREVKSAYYESKYDEYVQLARRYFAESYAKYSDNPEYLFYVGVIIGPDPYIFNPKEGFDPMDMIHAAFALNYNTVLKDEFTSLNMYLATHNQANNIVYARNILSDSSLQGQLATKGSAGEYVIGRYVTWAKKVLENAESNGAPISNG